MAITWWGNIRFEKTFTPALCELLARSGCVAVSGGLEVASDRLLALMKKGVTVEQVARVTRAFTDAGVMVHAYLMYGFPTETEQETIDALERVRQLFARGLHPVGVLAPLRRDRAQPDRPAARSCSASALVTGAGGDLRAQRAPVRRSDRLRPRAARRRAAQGALQLHARRGAGPGRPILVFWRRVRGWRRGRAARPRQRRVPTTQVPADLIANALRNS